MIIYNILTSLSPSSYTECRINPFTLLPLPIAIDPCPVTANNYNCIGLVQHNNNNDKIEMNYYVYDNIIVKLLSEYYYMLL